MRKPIFLAVALALVAAACTESAGSSSDGTLVGEESPTPTLLTDDTVVATVNGVDIHMSRVRPMHPFREDLVPPDVFAGLMTDVIVQEIVVQGAEAEFGLRRDEAAVDSKYEELKLEIEENLGSYESFLIAENRTDYAIREIAFQSLMREQVLDEFSADLPPLTDEAIQAEYEARLPAFTQICLSRIIVETGAAAQVALGRIEAGEPFAVVAAEVSIEPGAGENGGNLGCPPPTAFQGEVAEAALDGPLGEPIGPIETALGFHILQVESRFVPTLEEAVPLIEAGRFTTLSLRFTEWVQGLVVGAEVIVVPEFGNWRLLPSPGVSPPEG